MLTLKKSSFIFRLWKRLMINGPFSKMSEECFAEELERANLCKFFWQVVGQVIGTVIICGIFWFVAPVFLTLGACAVIVALVLGYRPCNVIENFKSGLHELTWVFLPMYPVGYIIPFITVDDTYCHYRTIRLFGRALYPIHLLAPVLLYWLGQTFWLEYQTNEAFAQSVIHLSLLAGSFIGVIVVMAGILAANKSEAGKLFRAYLKAKKDRVCPRIEFTDD